MCLPEGDEISASRKSGRQVVGENNYDNIIEYEVEFVEVRPNDGTDPCID